MKLKVINLVGNMTVYNGINKKTGKSYSIYSWPVMVAAEGGQFQTVIKSMKQMTLELKEYEVKESNYNGNVSYMIQFEQEKKSGYSRPTYTVKEYDALWGHVLGKVPVFIKHINNLENEQICSLIATYIISATNAGVKVENTPSTVSKTSQPMAEKLSNYEDEYGSFQSGSTFSGNGNNGAQDHYNEGDDTINF